MSHCAIKEDQAAPPNFGERLAGLIRDVSALARSTSLDRETDPRRVLPLLPAAVLWRLFPRILDRAADLAAAMPAKPVTEGELEFMRQLADTIEIGGPAPRVAGVPAKRGMNGDGI